MKNDEQIKLELDTLLAEYNGIRGEVVSFLDGSRTLLNLSLTFIGVLIAGMPFVVEKNILELFLIAPLVFYLLAWTQARYALIDDSLTRYLLATLSPSIRKNLESINPTQHKDFKAIMSRENVWEHMPYNRSIWYFPLRASTYLIPLLGALLSVIAFIFFAYKQARIISLVDIVLLVTNSLLILYTVYLGFRVNRDLSG